jgi:hypothetical protein
VNYENTNNLKIYFLSRYQPKQFCGWLFLSYANGIPLNTLETSSYGSLNSGAQQAFLAYNAFVIDPRVLIQMFIIKRTRRRKLLPRKHDYY